MCLQMPSAIAFVLTIGARAVAKVSWLLQRLGGQLIQKLVSDYYKAIALQERVIRKSIFKEIATMHQLSLSIQ